MEEQAPSTQRVSTRQLRELLGDDEMETTLFRGAGPSTRVEPATVMQVRAPVAGGGPAVAAARATRRAALPTRLLLITGAAVAAVALLGWAWAPRASSASPAHTASDEAASPQRHPSGERLREHVEVDDPGPGGEREDEHVEDHSEGAADRPRSDQVELPANPDIVHAALDALVRGDRVQARDHYRALAQQTGRPVFVRLAELLERRLRCEGDEEGNGCD